MTTEETRMAKDDPDGTQCPCAPDEQCLFPKGEQQCARLDKAGVPRDERWRALLMAMGAAGQMHTLSEDQKLAIGELFDRALNEGNFSVSSFKQLAKDHEEILSSPHKKKLQATLDETTRLLEDVRSMAQSRQGDVQDLQSRAVDAVTSGKDPTETVAMLRSAFTEVLSSMEKDVEDLGRISRTDGLTGLNNRRALDEFLEELEESWIQGKFPVSMIMIDIDHFKKFNDTYGHRVGDQALVVTAKHITMFANTVTRTKNFECFPARYGGEEFAVVMPNVPLGNAVELAEELRKRIANHKLRLRNPDGTVMEKGIYVTASLGVSAMKPHWHGACSANLVEEADKALYKAKQNGRDRVEVMDVDSD